MLRLTFGAFLVVLMSGTAADPDLWGHLRFGLDIVASGSIHSSDPYSFTSDRQWINHEWLAELLMGIAYSALGPMGLNLLKVALILSVGLIVLAVARQEQARPLARDLLVGLALFSTYSRMQAVRPQIFSIAIFCVVLYLLRAAGRGKNGALYGVPICFAVWANLHGGWIVGIGAVGAWLAAEAWARREWRAAGRLACIGALALGATLVNPYGIGLWAFLIETVQPVRADITDWKPFFDLPPAILMLQAILPAIAVAAVATSRHAVPLSTAAILAVLAAAVFKVGRVDAFLQAALAILLGPQIVVLLERLDDGLRQSFRRRSAAVGALALTLAVYASATGLLRLRTIAVVGPWIPDREAAMHLRDNYPGMHVLTWFDWGEYAIWQLSPVGIKVSMDGRRETVYSAAVLDDHYRFYRGEPGTASYPDRIGADLVWLPSEFPGLAVLREAGWQTAFASDRSVILTRDDSAAPLQASSEERRVFPWP